MRKKIVAGNWKMNGSRSQAKALTEEIKQGAKEFSAIDIILFPSFVYLSQVENIIRRTHITCGAQNLYVGSSGAFTGEISGAMLKDVGCRYVLVGHSERRQLFHEGLVLVAAKFKAAEQAGLIPILCVGETLDERKQEQTESVIQQQLASVIEAASIGAFREAIIAYEPVWAIGTGLTATPEQAQAVHAMIREQLATHDVSVAEKVQILYGGSVKADNAQGLFAMPDIDGGLVGGASLEAKGFLAICAAAM